MLSDETVICVGGRLQEAGYWPHDTNDRGHWSVRVVETVGWRQKTADTLELSIELRLGLRNFAT